MMAAAGRLHDLHGQRYQKSVSEVVPKELTALVFDRRADITAQEQLAAITASWLVLASCPSVGLCAVTWTKAVTDVEQRCARMTRKIFKISNATRQSQRVRLR